MGLRKLYTRSESPNGRRTYNEWGEEFDWRAIANGDWLICRKDGATSIRPVEPAYAEVAAAARAALDKVTAAVQKAKIPSFDLPPAVLNRAWKAFYDSAKRDRCKNIVGLCESAHGVAMAAVEAIEEAAKLATPKEAIAEGYTIDDLMVVFERKERGTQLEKDIIDELGRRREARRLEREQERRGYRRHEAAPSAGGGESSP